MTASVLKQDPNTQKASETITIDTDTNVYMVVCCWQISLFVFNIGFYRWNLLIHVVSMTIVRLV